MLLPRPAPSFSSRLKSENHTLKRALTDPRLFAGIGNAYSEQAGDAFPEKVTALRAEMAVHGRYGKPCPACARCQTGGRVLADRALSRLLKKRWPRSIDG